MKFNFGGSISHFGKKEFGLKTRLKTGPVLKREETSSYNRIKDECFNNEDKITNVMVKDVFKTTEKYMKGDDMVKLALLYLLEYGPIRKDSHAQVDHDHLHIIDDLKFFNTYLWGEVLWAAIIASLHNALEKPNKSGTYSVRGCPIAFQYNVVAILEPTSDAKLVYCRENMLITDGEGGPDDEQHDDIMQPRKKRARSDGSQQQNVHNRIHIDVQWMKKEILVNQNYIKSMKSELSSMKETLKVILRLVIVHHKSPQKARQQIDIIIYDEEDLKIIEKDDEHDKERAVPTVVAFALQIYMRLKSPGIVEFHYQNVGVQFFQNLITSEAWLTDEDTLVVSSCGHVKMPSGVVWLIQSISKDNGDVLEALACEKSSPT
ncbi:hypothetical protein FNV43_RR18547 [Rhamnella rubrinervis]|uniref:DUF1985 domain-containing protein n=1 Tax=Rhamnella rubrinervis TaxID=2594499 RepID=A0A8K0GWI5_9ROSA|nr:hypothetical protein FNV43_RR18547 [Rhamnella rubrinervis]